MQNPEEMIEAAAYTRVSSQSLKNSPTLEGQMDTLKEAMDRKSYHYTPDHLYSDAKSGFERPYYQREDLMAMLAAAKNGEFQILMVTEFSRIGRDADESRFLIYLLEKEYGVQVESLTQRYDDTPEGRLMRDIDSYMDTIERGKITERVTRGRLYRGKDNLLGQGIPLYGYQYVDTKDYDKARYACDHEIVHTDAEGKEWSEFAVVGYVYTSYLAGHGLRKIAMLLTEKGIPTRKGLPYWNQATIYQMLTNRAYTGEAISFKYQQYTERDRNGKVTKAYSKERPVEEQNHLDDGIIPPIVSVETFEAVQRRLAQNKQEALRHAKYPYIALLRAGRAKCSICHNTMRVQNYSKVEGNGQRSFRPEKSLYGCYVKNGLTGEQNYHRVYMAVSEADAIAWSFALEHLYEPQRIRDEVEAQLKDVIYQKEMQEFQKTRLQEIHTSIKRLTKISASCDEEDLAEIEGRIAQLEKEQKSITTRLNSWEDIEAKRDKIYAAIEQFEEWIQTVVIPNLNDPDFNPPHEDKEEIFRMLGIWSEIKPKGVLPRVTMHLGPPSIMQLSL
jgi:DNA invertase Pin-like site-specific DNA recombinase